MPLINTSIPNLIGGVSQQPDAVRFDGQCEEQTNAISSVVDGLSKRPNTQHIAKLVSSAISSNSFVHFVDRSDAEKYVIIHDGTALKAWNLDGTPCTINGSASYTTSGLSYINTSTPRQDLKALTVGDTTFLLNTTKTVNASSTTTPALDRLAVVTILQGDYEKDYSVSATIIYSTADNATPTSLTETFTSLAADASEGGQNASSETIATGLKGKMTDDIPSGNVFQRMDTHFTIIQQGNSLYLTQVPTISDSSLNSDLTTSAFQISTSDGLADTGMNVAYREIESITELPAKNKNGFRIKVRGQPDLNEDDYYVEFVSNNNSLFGKGSYTETVGFEISTGIDNATMPHKLVSTAPNTFTLEEASYTTRQAGDDDTNPQPSFVSPDANTPRTISNIFFFKNRLGFLSEDKVIMSEAGQPFNFFRTTVTTLLDGDPIDVQVSSQKVTNLKSATGFQENLILFAENSQFVLKGGELLTPRTVSVTPVTNFDSSSTVNPIPLGAYMYFPYESGSFSGVREYTINASTDVYDSTEITEHIPSYIPKNVYMFDGSSTEDALAIVSSDEPSSIYVYRYFFNGQKKLLSSWFKFTLDGNVKGLSFSKSNLFIVLSKNSETHLLNMPFESNLKDTGVQHNTYLDMRRAVSVPGGATSFSLSSFYTPTDNSVQVYTTDGALVQTTNSGATVNLTAGALHASNATSVWVGIPYTMSYTFSKLLFQSAQGQSKTPSAAGKLMLKSASLFYANTAHFKVKVTPEHRETHTNVFNPNIINSTTIGLTFDTGHFRVPVFSQADDTTITIENASALPSNFQSVEFEAYAHQRSKRIG